MTDAGPPPGGDDPVPEGNPLAILADAGRPPADRGAPSATAAGSASTAGDQPAKATKAKGAKTKAPKAAKEPKAPKPGRGRKADAPAPGPDPAATAALASVTAAGSGGARPPRPPVPPRTPADDARTSIIGFVIIAVAVLLGSVLLWKGYARTDGNLIAGATPDSSAPPRSTTIPATSTTLPPTTTTTAPLKPPSQVTVRVANAGNLPGTPAGDATAKLQKAGYKTLGAIDAPVIPTSVVYYTDDLQGEATEIANALGIASGQVQAMPNPPPTGAQGAQVLVALGSDYKPT
ncbi:MAG: LytR C-terminal domain-containing protein [Acidimicrobiales bacterium]